MKDVWMKARVVVSCLWTMINRCRVTIMICWVGRSKICVRWIPKSWDAKVHELDSFEIHEIELTLIGKRIGNGG